MVSQWHQIYTYRFSIQRNCPKLLRRLYLEGNLDVSVRSSILRYTGLKYEIEIGRIIFTKLWSS